MFRYCVLLILAAVGLSYVLLVSGCTGLRPVLIAGVPDDLSLDLAVLPARGVTNVVLSGKALPVRQAHYLLYADGSLHSERGSSAGPNAFPSLTRRLTTDEMLSIWQYLNRLDLGVSPSSAGKAMISAKRPSDGVSYVIWLRARGVEESGRLETAGGEAADEGQLRVMSDLVALLDQLSW